MNHLQISYFWKVKINLSAKTMNEKQVYPKQVGVSGGSWAWALVDTVASRWHCWWEWEWEAGKDEGSGGDNKEEIVCIL